MSFISYRHLIYIHAGIFDKHLKHDGFLWTIDSSVTGRFVIEIEFLDLKVADPSVSTASLSASVLSMFGTTTIRRSGSDILDSPGILSNLRKMYSMLSSHLDRCTPM
jgi:hypothetical protein